MTEAALGCWYIIATTLPFWEGKSAAQVTYTRRPDGRVDDVLQWEQGGRTRRLAGVDTVVDDGFSWRGAGWLFPFTSQWRFVALDADHAVTWFARASFGVTPEGMDVYARAPDHDPAPDLARIAADPRFAHLSGWFRIPR